MTGRQEAFCREFVLCRDAREAAERAGYKAPNSAAERLMKLDEIRARISELEVADTNEVRAFLTRALRSEGGLSERIRAADMLLKCGKPEGVPERIVIFGEEDLQ